MKSYRLSVVVIAAALLCGAHSASAVTTISTDISTGGTLSVTGLSTLSGGASTTMLSALSRLFVGTSGTTTILGDSSTSTFSGGIAASGGGLHLTNGGIRVASLNVSSCDVKSDTSGLFYCGTDATGSSGAEINWTYMNGSGMRTSTTTAQVLIGGSATTSAQTLEVLGGGYFSGNLGVGTTSPYAKLSVAGNVVADSFIATSTSASSTFANGINLTGGCFAIAGTCISSGGGSGAVNSGTLGHVAYYGSSGTTISGTSTLFLTPTGKVGIGTTSPAGTFGVNGSTFLGGTLTVAGNTNLVGVSISGATTMLGALQLEGATTTTAGYGINLASGGCFAIAGTCITTSATGSVASVSAGNTSLTVTPTFGNVTAALNMGNANAWTAVQSFGALTMLNGNASTSQLSASSKLYVGASGTTTILGDFGTSTFSGGINLTTGCFAQNGTCISASSSTGAQTNVANTWTNPQTFMSNTYVGGYATVTASTGSFSSSGNVNAVNLIASGNIVATSGTLTLANTSTAISGIVFGTCSWNSSSSLNMLASSTAFVDCDNATGITTAHKVFLQATSSLPASVLVHSASSSAANTINIQLVNLGASAVNFGSFTMNFFGIR